MQTGLILLGLLVTFFRYPITESPTGTDNFYYISAVKAILDSGEIFWAENLLSIYGLFPGTTPLGSLILASVITEVSGLSVHDYHLIHSMFFSLIFTGIGNLVISKCFPVIVGSLLCITHIKLNVMYSFKWNWVFTHYFHISGTIFLC